MILIHSIEVQHLVPDQVTISWRLEPTSEDLNSYEVSVYQAYAPSENINEYTLIASGLNPASTSYFVDTSVSGLFSKFTDHFYLVQVSGITGQGVAESSPAGIVLEQDFVVREVVRRRQIVLDRFSGANYYLLKRKAYGTRCSECWDETLQRRTKSKCFTCYDTAYEGGYYAPTVVRGQLNQRPTREVYVLFGSWQDQDAVLYMQGAIPLNPKDIMVDRLSRRWIVLNVGSASKALVTIGQIVQVRQLEKEDIVYRYPVTF